MKKNFHWRKRPLTNLRNSQFEREVPYKRRPICGEKHHKSDPFHLVMKNQTHQRPNGFWCCINGQKKIVQNANTRSMKTQQTITNKCITSQNHSQHNKVFNHKHTNLVNSGLYSDKKWKEHPVWCVSSQ